MAHMNNKKVCPKCKKEKILNDFYNDLKRRDGKMVYCKKCKYDYQKKHRIRNPISAILRSIRTRCSNPKRSVYKYYGGKGIQCKFNSWQEIEEEIGPRPEGMTIDRIDSNGHYEKGNIRWATRLEQTINRSVTKLNKKDVLKIREMASNDMTYLKIGDTYHVSKGHISDIVNKKIWKHI